MGMAQSAGRTIEARLQVSAVAHEPSRLQDEDASQSFWCFQYSSNSDAAPSQYLIKDWSALTCYPEQSIVKGGNRMLFQSRMLSEVWLQYKGVAQYR